MPTINDYKKATLKKWTGLSGDINSLEYRWLRSVVVPYKGSIPDMWRKYLTNLGYTTGALNDRFMKYLASFGYTGSISNRWYQYWKNGVGVPSWVTDGAVLDYDFRNDRSYANGIAGTALTGLTVDRNSIGAYYDVNGILQFASANVARFDYHPVTHEFLGLLVEKIIDNYCLRSNDFTHAAWFFKTNVTLTASAAIGPDGTMSATKIEAPLSSTASLAQACPNFGSTNGNTASVYMKKGSGATDGNRLYLYNETTATGLALTQINFDTGVLTTTLGSASVQELPNGWYRVSVTATSGISTNDILRIYVGFTTNIPSAGAFCYVYGAQMEQNTYPSSYIPTVASTATRFNDYISRAVNTFGFNESVGSVKVEARPYVLPSPSNFAPMWCFRPTSTVLDRIEQYLRHTTGASRLFVRNAVGTQCDLADANGSIVTVGSSFKSMSAWAQNNFATTVNGAVVGSDLVGNLPVGIEQLYFGSGGPLATSVSTIHLHRLTYWPVRKTNAELVTLTT